MCRLRRVRKKLSNRSGLGVQGVVRCYRPCEMYWLRKVCRRLSRHSHYTCSRGYRMKKHWYDYLWIAEGLYLVLGFFNILFAWLGLIFFFVPLIIVLAGGGKMYCNKFCGRGQLFELLGGKLGLSLKNTIPAFMRSVWFRYGFMIFFMSRFGIMIYITYLVFGGAPLRETIGLFWVFEVPWHWAYTFHVDPWVARFAFGFYSVMMTSFLIGFVSNVIFKPRSWCVFCPMGTMTQGISKLKNGK